MKIEVHLQGGLRKIIDITPGATVGATIGRNVFNADGTLYVPPSPGGTSQLSITSWELILNIPPNVTALANTNTTGLYTITGPGTSATRALTAVAGETTVSNGDGVAGNPAVGLADVADTGAGALRGITRDAKGRINGTTDATITGTAGQVDVANGDAAAGLPTISLADVADAGGGVLLKTTFDTKGRQTGSSPAEIGDLADVDLVTAPPVDGDTLVFDAVSGTWVPGAGTGGGVQSVVEGAGIDVDATDPANPIVALDAASIASLALADSAVQSVVGGTNVSVDSADPQNPIVNVTIPAPTVSIQASENIAAGDFVRLHDSGGARVRRADNTTASGDGCADGYVLAAVTSGAMASVYFDGRNNQLTGLAAGDLYVLSTAGDVVEISTLPAVSGTILQVVGTAISATELSVNIQSAILRE